MRNEDGMRCRRGIWEGGNEQSRGRHQFLIQYGEDKWECSNQKYRKVTGVVHKPTLRPTYIGVHRYSVWYGKVPITRTSVYGCGVDSEDDSAEPCTDVSLELCKHTSPGPTSPDSPSEKGHCPWQLGTVPTAPNEQLLMVHGFSSG